MLPRSIQLQAAQRCIHGHTATTVATATNNFAQPALLCRRVSSLTSQQARLRLPQHHQTHSQQQPQSFNGPMHAGRSIGSTRTIITGTYPSSRLDVFNRKLRNIAKDPRTCMVLFEKCRELRDSKMRPDLTTYTILLEGHERNHDFLGLMRTLEEMILVGIQPDISAYNIGLRAAAAVGDTIMMEQIKEMVRESGLQLNLNSYEIIIQGLCQNYELEHALDLLGDMTVSVNKEGFPDENGRPTIDIRPSQRCFVPVIQLAQNLHESETAYLVLKMAEVQSGLSQIPATVYLDLLARAADDYVLPAVEYCWRKAVKEMKAQPDEGTCMLILNCAGQGVAPKLSAEVIQYMGESGMTFQEYHFAPLLQAFSLGKKFKSAFNVLSIMRKSGMQPSILTATSLLKVLDDPANVEEAFSCMQSMHQEGKVVDVVAFNVLLEACGRNRNLIRAMGIFESSASLGVKPDTDTYNALLSGCIMDKNMVEGRNVITMMQRAGVDPNVDTYQSLITLCLTQINYEDAFMYLEEMKSHNVIPSEPIYTSLVRKLARENDPRIKFAVEEMESFGYVVGPNLRQYIETGGLSNLEESERRRQIRIAQRRRSAAFQRVRVK